MIKRSDHPVKLWIWIPSNVHWSFTRTITPTLYEAHIGSSGSAGWKTSWKTSSLQNHPSLCPKPIFFASDNPNQSGKFHPSKTCSLSNTSTQNPTRHFYIGSDNPASLTCLSDLADLDNPTLLSFAELVQFSISLSSFFVFCFTRAFLLHSRDLMRYTWHTR